MAFQPVLDPKIHAVSHPREYDDFDLKLQIDEAGRWLKPHELEILHRVEFQSMTPFEAAADLGINMNYQKASRLVNRARSYCALLREHSRRKYGATIDWKIKHLRETATDAKAPGNYSASIGAIAELNKMAGDHAPTKNVNLNLGHQMTDAEMAAIANTMLEAAGADR